MDFLLNIEDCNFKLCYISSTNTITMYKTDLEIFYVLMFHFTSFHFISRHCDVFESGNDVSVGLLSLWIVCFLLTLLRVFPAQSSG